MKSLSIAALASVGSLQLGHGIPAGSSAFYGRRSKARQDGPRQSNGNLRSVG